jgi:L-rhamnose mutarotase
MERAWAHWIGGAAIGALAAAGLMRWMERRRGEQRRLIMFRTRIKKEKLEAYVRHHMAVWPEVENGLRAHGVRLLSIHRPKDGSNEFNMFIELDPGVDMQRDLGPGSSYRADSRVQTWETAMCTYFEIGGWEELAELYTLTPTSSTNTLPSLPLSL